MRVWLLYLTRSENVPPGPGALAELSRQLVQAKTSEAEAQRKLRLAARTELELRALVKKREDRIEELKRGLPPPGPAARGGRRAGRHSRSNSSEFDSDGETRRRCRCRRCGMLTWQCVAGPADAAAEEGRPAAPSELAALKAELARREAQIERLEVSLAQASRPEDRATISPFPQPWRFDGCPPAEVLYRCHGPCRRLPARRTGTRTSSGCSGPSSTCTTACPAWTATAGS